jgi:adenylate cyclase
MKQPASVAVIVSDPPLTGRALSHALSALGLESRAMGSDIGDRVGAIAGERPEVVLIRRGADAAEALALARELRADPRTAQLRVVLMSPDAAWGRDAIEAGAHAHLCIPFNDADVRDAVRGVVPRRPVILCADDSRTQRRIVVPALKAEGYEVLEAEDGEEALAIVRARPDIALVLSDVEMPRRDGFGLCAAIKADERTRALPVVLVTGLDSDDAIGKGFQAGADDYITKPVVLPELVTRVRRFVQPQDAERTERVLVLADESRAQTMLTTALSAHGLRSVVAGECSDALGMLDGDAFQLLLVDTDSRCLDAAEFVRAVRGNEVGAELPIILVAGRSSLAQLVKVRSAGVQAVVSKPFQPERLLAEVERVLAEAREQRQRVALRRYLSGDAVRAVDAYVASGADTLRRASDQHRSVLFADVAGFTRLCESKPPAEVVTILNRFHDVTVDILLRHGGGIDKFIGDAVMAVFEGEAVGARGAVRAGLELIEDGLPALREELGIPLHVRIGVNSGHVIVGDIGSRHFRRDYTVIGDTVNVAQRLQSAAPLDGVVVSEATRLLLGDEADVEGGESLALKGRANGVVVWKVRGMRA